MKPKASSCSKSKPSNANEGGGGASLRTRLFLSSSSFCSKTPLHPKSSSKKKHLHSNSKDKDKENLNYNVPRTRNSQKPINSNIVNTNIPGKNPKKPSSKTPPFSRHHNNLTSTLLQQQQQQEDINKMPTLESSSSSSFSADKLTQTPPVEASVSPEMIAFTSTPPASSCFGAGHVLLSGVSDMRKCRPKGLLQAAAFAGTKTNHCKLSSPCSSSSSCCLFPSPAHASMHWLSSPSSSTLKTHTHTQDNLTPTHAHHSKSFLDLDLDYQTNSPFSTTHSLQPSHSGSANLIRTPDSDSDSTAATYVVDFLSSNSNNNKTMFDSQLQLITCSLAQTLGISTASPNTIQPQLPITDRDRDRDRDSIRFSFQFDSFTTSSTSVFLSQGEGHLHQIPHHTHASSCNSSCSTLGNSWTRQGLMSQIFENDMAEFDCCRCLSDDDDDHNHNDIFPLCDAGSSDTDDAANSLSYCCSPKNLAALANQNGVEDNVGQQNHPSGVEPLQLSSSCAESISTDGGGLVTSVDSDWDLCYNNDLFRV